ncbi:MAG: sugar phosphate isomerase/epimerase [Verrucomicrobia bacterium]|nr:sugar phosphate isomerase/epimerase [Verrucomicrobiota bacterium]
MYSLSTCWNSHRHTDGRSMLNEVAEMGFEYAELSHGIRISLLPGIYDAVDAGEIKISTLHNFCPLPIGINTAAPNIFKFTSDNPRERENAWRHTIKTLDTAVRVKAQLVVLHMGNIDMKDYGTKLEELCDRGERHTLKYQKLLAEADQKREQKKERPVQLAYDFLTQLIPEAESRGLKLGIENREAVEEIPLDGDFAHFFRIFQSKAVGYWHDCGHAQIKENLGFLNHPLFLEGLSDRLLGFHIHDVRPPARDHCPPGTGMIDFKALKPFVRPDHIKVFELSPGASPDDARRGVAHLKAIWGEG